MKPFTFKRFVLLPLIVFSLILTTGCHLLSHYSEDEVQQYINKNYPNLTYHLESRRDNTWQVTFAYWNIWSHAYLCTCCTTSRANTDSQYSINNRISINEKSSNSRGVILCYIWHIFFVYWNAYSLFSHRKPWCNKFLQSNGSILQRICCNISRFQRKNIY